MHWAGEEMNWPVARSMGDVAGQSLHIVQQESLVVLRELMTSLLCVLKGEGLGKGGYNFIF